MNMSPELSLDPTMGSKLRDVVNDDANISISRKQTLISKRITQLILRGIVFVR